MKVVCCLFTLYVLCIGGFKRNMSWHKRYELLCRYCSKKDFLERIPPMPIDDNFVVTNIRRMSSRLCRLDDRFLSFTIDTLEMKRKNACSRLNSVKVNNLVKALSPAYLRLGGTPQDFLTFVDDEAPEISKETDELFMNCTPKFVNWKQITEFNITSKTLLEVLRFGKRNNLSIILGLNARRRNRDNSWDYRNPKKIIEFVLARNFTVDWELGNEPTRFKKYGINLSVQQLVADLNRLKSLIGNSRIFGPDISQPSRSKMKFLRSYLQSDPPVDAVTYHQYWMPQSKSTLSSYLDPSYIDRLYDQMQWMVNTVRRTNNRMIWLGETGSSSGGGRFNLSDTYAAGFLYLSKLGIAALNCHRVVIRQSFYGGYYGLLDSITRDPTPDYWSSLLYKRLIGNTVLNITTDNRDVFFKIFAYCSKRNREDVVIMFINFNKRKTVRFSLFGHQEKEMTVYLLTAVEDNLQSKRVLLNGRQLNLTSKYRIPKMKGVLEMQPVSIPKTSYGFLQIRDVRRDECML